MNTFVIKTIVNFPPAVGLERCPNMAQVPERKIVYSLQNGPDRGGIPKRVWKVMNDGTLTKIHEDWQVRAWVHREDDRWFWTPLTNVTGSYTSFPPYEFEIDEED